MSCRRFQNTFWGSAPCDVDPVTSVGYVDSRSVDVSGGARYAFSATYLDAQGATQFRAMLSRNGGLVYEEVVLGDGLKALEESEEFRRRLTEVLRSAVNFPAFFFEMPGATPRDRLTTPFEFTVVDAPRLARASADPAPFSAYFNKGIKDAVAFQNLGGDAMLVAPCPQARGMGCYAHLAEFVRNGSMDQISQFWRLVGKTAREEMSRADSRGANHRLWMSTAGQGVSWLHFRIESTPKYYSFAAYKAKHGGRGYNY